MIVLYAAVAAVAFSSVAGLIVEDVQLFTDSGEIRVPDTTTRDKINTSSDDVRLRLYAE